MDLYLSRTRTDYLRPISDVLTGTVMAECGGEERTIFVVSSYCWLPHLHRGPFAAALYYTMIVRVR